MFRKAIAFLLLAWHMLGMTRILSTAVRAVGLIITLGLLPAILLHESCHYVAAWCFRAGDRRLGVIYEDLIILGFGVHYDDDDTSAWQDECITFAPFIWLVPAALLVQFGPQQYTAVAFYLALTGLTGVSDVLQRFYRLDISKGADPDAIRFWWLIGDGPRSVAEHREPRDP